MRPQTGYDLMVNLLKQHLQNPGLLNKMMSDKKINIGTSGWSYKNWKGIFYAPKMKPTDYLSFYAKSFNITDKMLNDFAKKFRKWTREDHVIWAFFNNDARGYALHDAQRLEEIMMLK